MGRTLRTCYKTNAATVRDYIAKFRPGHFIWLGPGAESTWNFQNSKGEGSFGPQAEQFMNIIAESQQPIINGAPLLDKCTLLKDGRNMHITATYQDQQRLTELLIDVNAISWFLGTWWLTSQTARTQEANKAFNSRLVRPTLCGRHCSGNRRGGGTLSKWTCPH